MNKLNMTDGLFLFGWVVIGHTKLQLYCWSVFWLYKTSDMLHFLFSKQRLEISNTCHLTCVLQLELSVHEHHRDLTNSISSLQQLCCLHPYHPWYWLNLAMSYQRLLESERCLEDQMQTNNMLKLKTIMCFIRTRYLNLLVCYSQF